MLLGWKSQYCENDYTINVMYKYNAIPIKLPMALFTELEQKNVTIHMKHKRPQAVKAILRKKNGAGGMKLPDFRL